jgi:lysine 6-dehydrogenase
MEEKSYRYLILGAGRQGTAAAYDLVRFGNARSVLLTDMNPEVASRSAERVNRLCDRSIVEGTQLNVKDFTALLELMKGADVCLSAVPYYYNVDITHAAIDARTHLCDMGGNTSVVREQLNMTEQAREAGISAVPDCGMGPGLINTMGAYVIDMLDTPMDIYIYDAGLPQNPQPPWNYELTFHINGLTNEMDGQAVFIRDGRIEKVDTLTEPEVIEFQPFGKLEAEVTSGGTSTAPWTFLGKVRTYENKVLRYPGHFEWLRAFKILGLFSEQPIRVGDRDIVPRQLYHVLLEPKISSTDRRDVGMIRVIGKGKKDGRDAAVTVDLVDYSDTETGFTAMERLTGWHCSVMMFFQAQGKVRPGVTPVEIAVPAAAFMEELRKRGIRFEVRWD